jgi:hypothetical protein
MGMDLTGIKPKNLKGEYFGANLWAWRPINFLCYIVNEKENYGFNMEYWDSNDGYGLNTSKDCNKLADGIDKLLLDIPLSDEDDRLYLNMGFWVNSSNSFIQDKEELNNQFPIGSIIYTSIIDKNGEKVEPAHSISLGRIKDFVEFLRNSGGFKIY